MVHFRPMCKLWSLHPPVGVYIAILALLGVIVPLVRDITKIGKREKALWTLIMFVLVLLEIKSIYQDRNEHEAQAAQDRTEQIEHFEKIASGIDATIANSDQQFQATMSRSGVILGGVTENLRTLTGNDSFAYAFVTGNGDGLNIVNRGEYPLSALYGNIHFEKGQQGEFQIPVLTPHLQRKLYPHNFSDAAYHNISIAFNAINGNWIEELQVRSIGGTLVSAIRIIRISTHSRNADELSSVEAHEIWCLVDSAYPTKGGVVDWEQKNVDQYGNMSKLLGKPCTRH